MDDFISFSDVYTHLICYEYNDHTQLKKLNEDSLHIDKKSYKGKKSNTIMFDVNTYLKNILSSYKNSSEMIWHQFKLDLPRTPVSVFNNVVQSVDHFKALTDHCKMLSVNINEFNIDLQTYLAMVCNQSSFCFPFVVMHQLYTNANKCQHLFAKPDKRKVEIRLNEFGTTVVELTAVFNTINTNTSAIIKTVEINVQTELNQFNYGTMNWTTT